MKAAVIKRFADAQNPGHPPYEAGSPFEGSPSRVQQLEELGFVKAVEDEEPKKATRKTTRRKA